MFDFAALERRVAALEANRGASLRFGRVVGVNTADGSARVQLPDGDGMLSAPLRVLQRRSLKDKEQCLPDLGEPVACLFAGQGLEAGVVLGAHYSTQTPAPGRTATHDYTVYEDGTELWYDRKAHKLIAKVRGDAEIETRGAITAAAGRGVVVESHTGITLKAPRINLAGKLCVTDRDGRAGSGDLIGDYRVVKGSFAVPDGDVIAGVTSLRGHLHDGVESGPSVSGAPTDGGQNGDSGLTDDSERERIFGLLTDFKDQLVRCMPEMVANEAQRTLEQGNLLDRQGWLYLHEGILKWLHGKSYVMKDKYDNGGQEPLWVEWDWLMRYERFRGAVEELKRPEYLFSERAKANLTGFLRQEGAFEGQGKPFDHIRLPWQEWRRHAIQGKDITVGLKTWEQFANATEILDEIALFYEQIKPDGFQVAIANTTVYALTSGRTELRNGRWRVVVEQAAFFIHDGFDFNGDQRLGYWICEDSYVDPGTGNRVEGEKAFKLLGEPLGNKDFRQFREATGYGCDFRTICVPEVVITKEYVYDAS